MYSVLNIILITISFIKILAKIEQTTKQNNNHCKIGWISRFITAMLRSLHQTRIVFPAQI